jgi:DNA-binding transcriptional ArsR family regulator
MPRLSQTATIETPAVQFTVSPTLDMLNAMYFTSLVPQMEGIDGWPAQLRSDMAPDLLAELDALYDYPAGDPGVMGILGDDLFGRPEVWSDVDRLIEYVRSMPLGDEGTEAAPGVQRLIYQTTFRYPDNVEPGAYDSFAPREAVQRRMDDLKDRDGPSIMALYDRPAELRERMARLIERFYAEHYRQEMGKRLPALERSVVAQSKETIADPAQLAARLTGRQSCLEGACAGPFSRLVFAPSLDMGPYSSCAIIGDIHGLIYPLEPVYRGTAAEEAEEARLARVYKALGDEQRLRILRMLRDREMYAQEIVERTGLHQSVVSRHLQFMRAVGLLQLRKQNNMKFFSLNPTARDMLSGTLALFDPASRRIAGGAQ